jgi:hypothetical protein
VFCTAAFSAIGFTTSASSSVRELGIPRQHAYYPRQISINIDLPPDDLPVAYSLRLSIGFIFRPLIQFHAGMGV